MNKSPNWLPEELMLALELYYSKDLSWLSKMSDSTPEIRALSYILQNLDYHNMPRPAKFRSAGSVRMKLSNFKAIDPRYGKSSLTNTGKTDRAVWGKYKGHYSKLNKACGDIIDKHFIGQYTDEVNDYISRLIGGDSDNNQKENNKKCYEDVVSSVSRLRQIYQNNEELELVQVCSDFIDHITNTDMYKKAYEEHGGINQERLQSDGKIGALVRTEMTRLILENRLSKAAIDQLESKEWCRATFHISHPFLKEINSSLPLKSQLVDHNGYLRYWNKIYSIDDKEYVLCKEWYESNRKHFLSWLSKTKDSQAVDSKYHEYIDVLKYIQIADAKSISISVADVKKHFPEYENVDEFIDFLIGKGVLSPYQGSLRELNVDDYDLLYDMLQKPEMIVREFKNER